MLYSFYWIDQQNADWFIRLTYFNQIAASELLHKGYLSIKVICQCVVSWNNREDENVYKSERIMNQKY